MVLIVPILIIKKIYNHFFRLNDSILDSVNNLLLILDNPYTAKYDIY